MIKFWATHNDIYYFGKHLCFETHIREIALGISFDYVLKCITIDLLFIRVQFY